MKNLNLLSKAEMKKVLGGVLPEEGNDGCYFHVHYANGQVGDSFEIAPTANGSSWANSVCVRWLSDINNHMTSCTYDCVHDGIGN